MTRLVLQCVSPWVTFKWFENQDHQSWKEDFKARLQTTPSVLECLEKALTFSVWCDDPPKRISGYASALPDVTGKL